jgi:hypothetical protein
VTRLPRDLRIESPEAEWVGHERAWASVQQFAPRKTRSSWWLVALAAVMVAVALAGLR